MENHTKTVGSALLLLAVVAGLLVGATGGVSAADVEIANDTVSVDNDTRSVYADVAAGNSSVSVNVTFSGISNGSETDLETRTVSLNASEEQLIERTNVNVSAYDSYRIVVTATGTNSTNATAEVGKISKVAGGGGGVNIGGQSVSIGVLAVVVLAAGAVLAGRAD